MPKLFEKASKKKKKTVVKRSTKKSGKKSLFGNRTSSFSGSKKTEKVSSTPVHKKSRPKGDDISVTSLFQDTSDVETFFKDNAPPPKKKRFPELWLPEDAARDYLMRRASDISGLRLHSVWLGKNQGGTKYVPCLDSIGECPLCNSGDRSFPYMIYEMIDVTGFDGNDGNHIAGFPQYFIANDNRAKLIQLELIDVDPESPVLIRMTRVGKKSNTTYAFKIRKEFDDLDEAGAYVEEIYGVDLEDVDDLSSPESLAKHFPIPEDDEWEELIDVAQANRESRAKNKGQSKGFSD